MGRCWIWPKDGRESDVHHVFQQQKRQYVSAAPFSPPLTKPICHSVPESNKRERKLTSPPDVTVSPRIGAKGSEPSFNASIDLTILPGTTLNNDTMLVLNARCANCRDYFDSNATAQPMIYAFGNGQNIQSDSPSAGLQRHYGYGSFTMNMLAATGPGGVPANSSAPNGVEMQGNMVRDHDRAKLAHAILGCLALFVFWPLNMMIVAVFKNIKIHVAVSVVIMVFFIVSFALGGIVSGQYNRVSLFFFSPSLPSIQT